MYVFGLDMPVGFVFLLFLIAQIVITIEIFLLLKHPHYIEVHDMSRRLLGTAYDHFKKRAQRQHKRMKR